MNVQKISTTSGVSSNSWAMSDEIGLSRDWHDMPLSLHVNISGSAVSGELGMALLAGSRSGSTFAGVVTGSGSSIILSSGTSVSGEHTNGSHWIPLSVVLDSGNTVQLMNVPYLKIASRASKNDVPFEAFLVS